MKGIGHVGEKIEGQKRGRKKRFEWKYKGEKECRFTGGVGELV